MFDEESEITQLKQLAKHLYVAQIEAVYGEEAIKIAEELTDNISEIYKYLDRIIFKQIIMLKSLSDNEILSDCHKISSLQHFSKLSGDVIIIEVLGNNEFNVKMDVCDSASNYSNNAIVYLKEEDKEFFYIKNDRELLTKLGNLDTYFIKPTFKSLDAALENYKINQARTSSCLILRHKVWQGGITSNRVVFTPGPEHIMRDSLYQFLNSYIRGNKEVMPEQNVNEKNPVDIRITWNYTNHVALIEIKWIGLSSSGSGYQGVTATKRVNKGSKQLSEYLDWFRTESPNKRTRGYLVVFDGRRKNVKRMILK